RQIREIESNTGTHIPIIALTASVTSDERKIYISKSVDEVAAKPIDFKELFNTMERLTPEHTGQTTSMDLKTAPSVEPVRQSPVIDSQKAMDMWGDWNVYTEALTGFMEKYKDAAQTIASCLDNGDIGAAKGISHSIRGLSGNLSMVEVYDIASKIDNLLKGGDTDGSRALLNDLAKAINGVAAYIEGMEVKNINPDHEIQELSKDELRDIFTKILTAYNQYNPDAVEPLLKELKGCLRGEQLAAIEKGIAELDFNRAKEETLRLMMTLEIDYSTT
ncbi:MAG: response regulator, partial [Nitrospirae bacterium]|nr:response regulator [Nitrospirota bacterium]